MIKRLKTHVKKFVGLDNIQRLIKYSYRSNPKILMYHRIIDHPLIPAITPSEFEEHLKYLVKFYEIIPLKEFMEKLEKNLLKKNTIAITFDDGHFDAYTNAWPILKKYKIPATLFVTTGFVNNELWLWPDKLKYILVQGQKGFLSENGVPELKLSDDNIQEVWNTLGDHYLTLTSNSRSKRLEALAKQLKVDIDNIPKPPFNGITWNQLKEMHSEGLEIGSHTVTHPILSQADAKTIEQELSVSKKEIERHIGSTVNGLCYPNGRPQDINETVIRVAKTIGYHYGVLAVDSAISPHAPFARGRLAAVPNLTEYKWRLTTS